MLLGYRIRQKSILWPLVAVMLPGWRVLVSLVRRPSTDMHTQLALRARVEQQVRAFEHAESGRLSRRVEIMSIYVQAHQAGLIKEPQLVDEAVVWLQLGDRDQAAKVLAAVEDPKKAGPYLAITKKTVLSQPLSEEERQELLTLIHSHPEDWWLTTLGTLHQMDYSVPASPAQLNRWSWWRLRAADGLPTIFVILALFLALPAFRILGGTWTIWPYSERVQRL